MIHVSRGEDNHAKSYSRNADTLQNKWEASAKFSVDANFFPSDLVRHLFSLLTLLGETINPNGHFANTASVLLDLLLPLKEYQIIKYESGVFYAYCDANYPLTRERCFALLSIHNEAAKILRSNQHIS